MNFQIGDLLIPVPGRWTVSTGLGNSQSGIVVRIDPEHYMGRDFYYVRVRWTRTDGSHWFNRSDAHYLHNCIVAGDLRLVTV